MKLTGNVTDPSGARMESIMKNIKDIARYCHVGVSTVSRVLNNHPDVSDETRAKVLRAIELFEYIPNNSARNLVRATSDAVAVLVHGVENPFFSRFVREFERLLYARGYSMALRIIPGEEDELIQAKILVKERRLKGILFLGGRLTYTPEEVAGIAVPFVCCTYSNRFGSLSEGAYSFVAVDDRREAERAVDYLYRLGHRRIAALIPSQRDGSVSELRFEGYVNALKKHGLAHDPALVSCSRTFDMAPAYSAMKKLITSGAKFTAVFASSDMMAIAAIKVLNDHGRRVPEDCSVIGIDGLELTSYIQPTLTTLVQPAAQMAKESVEVLLDCLERGCQSRHVIFETTLREGGSAAPPPQPDGQNEEGGVRV